MRRKLVRCVRRQDRGCAICRYRSLHADFWQLFHNHNERAFKLGFHISCQGCLGTAWIRPIHRGGHLKMPSSPERMNEAKSLGTFPFVLGGLSFIPLIGVLFGLLAIGWGLINRRRGGKKIALIGAGGIAFTIIL